MFEYIVIKVKSATLDYLTRFNLPTQRPAACTTLKRIIYWLHNFDLLKNGDLDHRPPP